MLFLLLTVAGVGGLYFLSNRQHIPPPAIFERCVATANGESVAVTPEQAHYAALISAIAVQRGMPPRAATIALATAYQESGIRNLDHGDRDSLGLFQQRPSQGWGTEDQIMDPVFSTHAFYDALARIPDWENGDINDTAQAVQRSGYPEAYRQHEPNARILASALTGHSPGGLTCSVDSPGGGSPQETVASLDEAFGHIGVTTARTPEGAKEVTFAHPDEALRWAVAHHAVANAKDLGVREVQVGDQQWVADGKTAPWNPVEPIDGVVIRF